MRARNERDLDSKGLDCGHERFVETGDVSFTYHIREVPAATRLGVEQVHTSEDEPLSVLTFLHRRERESRAGELDSLDFSKRFDRGTQRCPHERQEHVVRDALDLVDSILAPRPV